MVVVRSLLAVRPADTARDARHDGGAPVGQASSAAEMAIVPGRLRSADAGQTVTAEIRGHDSTGKVSDDGLLVVDGPDTGSDADQIAIAAPGKASDAESDTSPAESDTSPAESVRLVGRAYPTVPSQLDLRVRLEREPRAVRHRVVLRARPLTRRGSLNHSGQPKTELRRNTTWLRTESFPLNLFLKES